MTGMTRGRLPARVYWVRRLLVLGTAVLLVVGIARLLGGSSDGSSGPDRATQVADTGAPSSGTTSGSTTPDPGQQSRGGAHTRSGHSKAPVVEPSGPCDPSDIAITPSVPHPVAGQDVTLVLDISTVTNPACTWTLSGRTVAMKIAKGSKLIWSTVECARAIPTQDLVLRDTAVTKVSLTWNARRSEPGCPAQTDWALPGTYRLHVAALGGKPQDATFEMTAPPAAEVTQTAAPSAHDSPSHR